MFWRSRGFGKGWVMLERTYYLNGKEFWIFAYSLLLGWNCMAQFRVFYHGLRFVCPNIQ